MTIAIKPVIAARTNRKESRTRKNDKKTAKPEARIPAHTAPVEAREAARHMAMKEF